MQRNALRRGSGCAGWGPGGVAGLPGDTEEAGEEEQEEQDEDRQQGHRQSEADSENLPAEQQEDREGAEEQRSSELQRGAAGQQPPGGPCSHCGTVATASNTWGRHPVTSQRLCNRCCNYANNHAGQLPPLDATCRVCGSKSPGPWRNAAWRPQPAGDLLCSPCFYEARRAGKQRAPKRQRTTEPLTAAEPAGTAALQPQQPGQRGQGRAAPQQDLFLVLGAAARESVGASASAEPALTPALVACFAPIFHALPAAEQCVKVGGRGGADATGAPPGRQWGRQMCSHESSAQQDIGEVQRPVTVAA